MRKERKIINTNIRLNLCDEQDRQAWEYLQTMDREKYKSYTRAVVVASGTGSPSTMEQEKMSRTRRARPVSSMAARSSELHWGGMDSKFWK